MAAIEPFPAYATASAIAAVQIDPVSRYIGVDEPANLAEYSIDPYFVVSGLPVGDSDLGVAVDVDVYAGDLVVEEVYPDPTTVSLSKATRWLPSTGSYVTGSWVSYSSESLSWALLRYSDLKQLTYTEVASMNYDDLVTPGSVDGSAVILSGVYGQAPVLSETYKYWRAGGYVSGSALTFKDGQYLYTDTFPWTTDEFTVMMTAVLHNPADEWYGLFEATDKTPILDSQPHVGLRMSASGEIGLFVGDSVQSMLPIQAGISRPGQPVLVGMQVSQVNMSARVFVLDSQLAFQDVMLDNPQPFDARLLVGRSGSANVGTAQMELLELDIYPAALTNWELRRNIGVLDRVYGIST